MTKKVNIVNKIYKDTTLTSSTKNFLDFSWKGSSESCMIKFITENQRLKLKRAKRRIKFF